MSSNYQKKVIEQRKVLAKNGDFGKATEDIFSLLSDEERYKWGTAPQNLIPCHPRVMMTKDMIPGILKALEDDTPSNKLFRELLETDEDGMLPPSPEYDAVITATDKYLAFLERRQKDAHNFDSVKLERIAVLALGYQLYGNTEYGYHAIYALKNYLLTLDCKSLPFDQYRAYGFALFIAACVYDWCYDLLDEEDKAQLIAAAENRLCAGNNCKGEKFEIGFPPYKQSGVCGHGAEYQLLRDYISFSVAIYDENPSWWKYSGGRFYNDFLPMRNEYFRSGIAPQGTNYSTLRYTADLFSAWLIKTATGYNPYANLNAVSRSFFCYEYAAKSIYADGDGGEKQTVDRFRNIAFLTAYLTNDPGLLAQGEYSLGDKPMFDNTQGIDLISYIIMRGTGLTPAKNRHDSLPLINYNGGAINQFVTHNKHGDPSNASSFIRLRTRSTANHEHKDAGTFKIYYKGLLTNDGGVYDYYGNDHWRYFHSATVSHNGILVFNPEHAKEDKWYSGGQRYIFSKKTLSQWIFESDSDTGVLYSHECGYKDAAHKIPHYAYIAGDIAKAYDSDTVSYLERRMLTVYTETPDFPMALFVYDDVESVDPSFKKTFLMQICSSDAPKISGNRITTENGEGRLVLNSLSSGVKIKGVGGRKYDAEGNFISEKSRNYLINGKQCNSINKKDDGHWGRIEISPIEESKKAEFLNILYVTDRGTKKIAPKVSKIESDGVVGGLFGSTAVLFPTARNRGACEISATVQSKKGKLSYFVCGVASGEWSISVDGKKCGSCYATSEGELLCFTAPAGSITLTREE